MQLRLPIEARLSWQWHDGVETDASGRYVASTRVGAYPCVLSLGEAVERYKLIREPVAMRFDVLPVALSSIRAPQGPHRPAVGREPSRAE